MSNKLNLSQTSNIPLLLVFLKMSESLIVAVVGKKFCDAVASLPFCKPKIRATKIILITKKTTNEKFLSRFKSAEIRACWNENIFKI